MGVKGRGSGPTYLEVGLMIFLDLRCSIMWADQPEVLAITKIGVKKSLHQKIITYGFRIGCKHLPSRNQHLDTSASP